MIKITNTVSGESVESGMEFVPAGTIDLIEALQEENLRLRKALKPMVYYAQYAIEVAGLAGFNQGEVRADANRAVEALTTKPEATEEGGETQYAWRDINGKQHNIFSIEPQEPVEEGGV